MESLPTLATALGRTSGAQPQGPLLPFAKGAVSSASTGGLFEREVERALERQDETGGERVAEARASAVRERRDERDAGFDGDRRESGPRKNSEREPTQALVDAPLAQPRDAVPAAPNTTSGNAPGGEPQASSASTGSSGNAGGSNAPVVPVAPGTPQAGLPTTGGPGAMATTTAGPGVAGANGTGSVAATVTVNEATSTFLQAARGERGGAGVANLPGTPGDTALVDHAAEVLRQIRLALSPAAKRVVIDLHPEELGRLSIRMAMRDGRVSAVVRAESPQTLELLERHLPELRAVLEERGLETGTLELELASDGRPGERRGHAAAGRQPTRVAPDRGERIPDEASSTASSRTSTDGGVDTYA